MAGLFYGVAKGRKTGVFTTWYAKNLCSKHVTFSEFK